MTLVQPVWLLLAVPLLAALWVWRLPGRALNVMRVTVVLLILLGMCGPAILLPGRTGTVVVVADRSYSMPPGSEASEKEAITLIESARGSATDARGGSRDTLAVVSFGARSVIELAPGGGGFEGFKGAVDPDGSNLASALETALALIPQDAPGRILVLSDGRATGGEAEAVAAKAATRGTTVDYRVLKRPITHDVAILDMEAPGTVAPGDAFMITAWVQCPAAQKIKYELVSGETDVARGESAMGAGTGRLTFRDRASGPGVLRYVLRITGDEGDPVPENNSGKCLVGVSGPRPVLCVSGADASRFPGLLTTGGMNVKTARAESCPWSLEDLANYSAVVLENVEAQRIGQKGMENLAAWVSDHGAGIMVTGGRSSFGTGGYFKSPLDPILPVSMELRREHRKLMLAIVVALDRSGSMAVPVGPGRTKMDLANLASVEVLKLLGPEDQMGVLAVDSSAHLIAKLDKVANAGDLEHRILKIDSMGGGIFIYEALVNAAKMLEGSDVGTRHIILFADAADSEEPGDYKTLVDRCRKAGITVSVIGLGTEKDCDAGLLKDIASRGGGRVFFTSDAHELPRLFAQETFVVARSTFVDEPTPLKTVAGVTMLSGKSFNVAGPAGGYNLSYVRPGAKVAVVTADEYNAPFVAAWETGVGRALVYTGEVDGKYTGALARWGDFGEFLSTLARWAAGRTEDLPGNMLLTQELEGGACVLRLNLDPERESTPFAELPTVTTLRGKPGETPEVVRSRMTWTSPDTLTLRVPLRGDETALSSVQVSSEIRAQLPPTCLPYSTEYRPVRADEGEELLERLAKATGGRHRVELSKIWAELPRSPQRFYLGPWLMIAALCLFLLEVLERRTGLVLTRMKRAEGAKVSEEAGESGRRLGLRLRLPKLLRGRGRATEVPGVSTKSSEKPQPAEPTAPAKPEGGGVVEAMRQASRRAKRRM